MGTPVRLRPPRHPLDRRVRVWWAAQILLVAVPVAVAVAVWPGLWPLTMAVAAAGFTAAVLLPAWWYRVHRWEVTESAVYTRSGYFWQEWRIAPMSRIQTVDTVRGPLQQLFGLATVTVTTASAKGSVQIKGLDARQAGELAENLTQTTQATPGDAT